jgi:hypothetical protein
MVEELGMFSGMDTVAMSMILILYGLLYEVVRRSV